MTAPMMGLGWGTKEGVTRWLGKNGSWVGAYESWQKRQGIYVSGKGSMLAFLLERNTSPSVGHKSKRDRRDDARRTFAPARDAVPCA